LYNVEYIVKSMIERVLIEEWYSEPAGGARSGTFRL